MQLNKFRGNNKSKHLLLLSILVILCGSVLTVSTVYATDNVPNESATLMMRDRAIDAVEQPTTPFNKITGNTMVDLGEMIIETPDLSYDKTDYQPLVDYGYNNCGENATFSVDGCVCNEGYEGDAKSGCTVIPEPDSYTYGPASWQSVTTDVSGYWSDNAIVNAALSLVGSYGYWCTDVVNIALAAGGWSGSYTDGVEVGLDGMVPGDVIFYPSHYAIYVGNGMAVHGGYKGLNVILGDVVVGKQPYTAYHCQ